MDANVNAVRNLLISYYDLGYMKTKNNIEMEITKIWYMLLTTNCMIDKLHQLCHKLSGTSKP